MTKRLERKLLVDIRGMSEDDKKRVQDCFFKLGYKWIAKVGYQYMDDRFKGYTNIQIDGDITGYLMHSLEPDNPKNLACKVSLQELERITAEFTGEYVMQEFTKKDLRNGMLVEYRDGSVHMVWGGNFVNRHLSITASLIEYNLKLTHQNHKDMDIVNVYEHECNNTPLSFIKGKLLWTRTEEITELTLAEVAAKLGMDVKTLRIKGE